MDFIFSNLSSLEEPLQKIVPAASISTRDEYESFIGTRIPDEVEIHLPNDVKSKGRCKRIKKSKENKTASKGRIARMCGKCKQTGKHDAHNCSKK
jgi:hypothetical protein